jgi:hypothetical protein
MWFTSFPQNHFICQNFIRWVILIFTGTLLKSQLLQTFLISRCKLLSNTGGGHIFLNLTERPWGPTSILYNGNRVIPGGKATGTFRLPPTPTCCPRLNKERSYTSTLYPLLPRAFVSGCKANFTFLRSFVKLRKAKLTSSCLSVRVE